MITTQELVELAKKKTGADNATAKAIGAPRQTVAKWRKGENGPSAEYFMKLCALTGVSPTNVRFGKQPTPSQQAQGKARNSLCILC